MLHPYNPTYVQLARPNEFDAHLVNKKNLNAMKKTEYLLESDLKIQIQHEDLC